MAFIPSHLSNQNQHCSLALPKSVTMREAQEMKGSPIVRGEMRNGVGITAHVKGYHVTRLNVSFRRALSLEAPGRRRPYLLVRKLWRQSKWILVRAIEMVIVVVHLTRLRAIQIDGRIWLLRMHLDMKTSVSGSQTWNLDWIMPQAFFEYRAYRW